VRGQQSGTDHDRAGLEHPTSGRDEWMCLIFVDLHAGSPLFAADDGRRQRR